MIGMSDSPFPDDSAPPMQAWLRASAVTRSLLSCLCALSERFAQAKLSFEEDGALSLELEAPRRARLPKARFELGDSKGLFAACEALGAPAPDREGLELCSQALLALLAPLKPGLFAFMASSGCESLSAGRSLPLDPNLPGGVERHGLEAQDAVEDALEEPSTRECALALARLLIRPEHPLSQMVGALISEADSVEIAGFIEARPPAIPPSGEAFGFANARLFAKTRARSL